MENGNQNHYFKTTDLALASFLYASGVLLIDIDPSEPRRAIFIFEQPTRELLSSYQSGKATVNVLAFDNAQNELRGKLNAKLDDKYRQLRNGNR